jgi:peptidoglycan hydrolase CwlO-like protein
LIDALDLDIGNGAPIATLRTKLAALREQADALESDCQTAQIERDDFKAKLNQANSEIARLENEIREWQQQKSEDQRMAEEGGFWPGS